MAEKKRPPSDGSNQTPSNFPDVVTPRDLHATSDIRFVMLEIGKLTSSVDRLIADVKSQGDKIDTIRHHVSFIKGAAWVIGILIALGVAALKLL